MRIASLGLFIGLLTACGDGGASAAPAQPETVISRDVPGGRISVAATSGGAWRVTSDLGDISAVTAFAGVDYANATPLTVATGSDGSWSVNPAGATGPLLVSVTLADGSLIETGSRDFSGK